MTISKLNPTIVGFLAQSCESLEIIEKEISECTNIKGKGKAVSTVTGLE
jgi:hypothetical protein